MSSQKHSVSIYWSKGTPYKVDSYTVWTSKRFDTNIYAEQFKWGRNKERYAKRIKEQGQVRIRDLRQIKKSQRGFWIGYMRGRMNDEVN